MKEMYLFTETEDSITATAKLNFGAFYSEGIEDIEIPRKPCHVKRHRKQRLYIVIKFFNQPERYLMDFANLTRLDIKCFVRFANNGSGREPGKNPIRKDVKELIERMGGKIVIRDWVYTGERHNPRRTEYDILWNATEEEAEEFVRKWNEYADEQEGQLLKHRREEAERIAKNRQLRAPVPL